MAMLCTVHFSHDKCSLVVDHDRKSAGHPIINIDPLGTINIQSVQEMWRYLAPEVLDRRMDGQSSSLRGQREQQGGTGHVELQAGRRHGGVVLTVTWETDGSQFYQHS